MTVRSPHPSEASSIAALSIEVWLGTYLKRGINKFFADFALNEFTQQKVAMLIADPDQFILVSENEDGIDGYVRISTGETAPVEGCSETEIATLYVQPRHHGKGVGKRLLDAALQHCISTGIKSVWLTVNSENDQAAGFYVAQGFEAVGTTRFHIANQTYPNIVFQRVLT